MDHRNGRAHRIPKALPEQISPCNRMGPCGVPLAIPCMLRSVDRSATARCGCSMPRALAIAACAPCASAVKNLAPPSNRDASVPSFGRSLPLCQVQEKLCLCDKRPLPLHQAT